LDIIIPLRTDNDIQNVRNMHSSSSECNDTSGLTCNDCTIS